jgi:hypothetical protein
MASVTIEGADPEGVLRELRETAAGIRGVLEDPRYMTYLEAAAGYVRIARQGEGRALCMAWENQGATVEEAALLCASLAPWLASAVYVIAALRSAPQEGGR